MLALTLAVAVVMSPWRQQTVEPCTGRVRPPERRQARIMGQEWRTGAGTTRKPPGSDLQYRRTLRDRVWLQLSFVAKENLGSASLIELVRYPNEPNSRPPRGSDGSSPFRAGGFPRSLFQAPGLIADGDQEHRLPGILQQVDDPVLLIFEINRLAVGQQMQIANRWPALRQAACPFRVAGSAERGGFSAAKSLCAAIRRSP